MKPSERILEIWKELVNKGAKNPDMQKSILHYLDEEYEKNKPCEHEETEVWNDMDVCKKCNILIGKSL